MIGLDIKIPNEVGDYISKLFQNIEISSFNWNIQCDDILCYENGKWNGKQGLFSEDWLNGEDVLKKISDTESYYLIFLDMKAYPFGKERTTIKTYQDFLNSDCELVFLCVDSMSVEVYGKNETILQQIMTNCQQYQFDVKEILLQDAQERTMIAF